MLGQICAQQHTANATPHNIKRNLYFSEVPNQ